jgi:hypothetical protein
MFTVRPASGPLAGAPAARTVGHARRVHPGVPQGPKNGQGPGQGHAGVVIITAGGFRAQGGGVGIALHQHRALWPAAQVEGGLFQQRLGPGAQLGPARGKRYGTHQNLGGRRRRHWGGRRPGPAQADQLLARFPQLFLQGGLFSAHPLQGFAQLFQLAQQHPVLVGQLGQPSRMAVWGRRNRGGLGGWLGLRFGRCVPEQPPNGPAQHRG